MSALPKAVQAQLDQAEAIQAQLVANAAPAQGNTDDATTPGTNATQVEPTEVQETQVTATVPDDQWENRFKVLQGKYNAEIPRLSQQNKELSERLEQAIRAMEAKQPDTPVADQKLVTDADVESFGSELIDMVRRASREEFDVLARKFADEMDKRFGQVAEKVETTEKRVVKSDTDKFWEKVVAQAPDFDSVNEDPRWFDFLDTRITGTRLTRRAVAEQAIASLDALALVEQVTAFKESIAEQSTQEPAVKPKKNLTAQIAPSSSKASTPSAPTGRIYTGSEYAAALDHRNLQRMSRAEYDAQVAEAELALAEGRVKF